MNSQKHTAFFRSSIVAVVVFAAMGMFSVMASSQFQSHTDVAYFSASGELRDLESAKVSPSSPVFADSLKQAQQSRFSRSDWPRLLGTGFFYRNWISSMTPESRKGVYRMDLYTLEAKTWAKLCHWNEAKEVVVEGILRGVKVPGANLSSLEELLHQIDQMASLPSVVADISAKPEVTKALYADARLSQIDERNARKVADPDLLIIQAQDRCGR